MIKCIKISNLFFKIDKDKPVLIPGDLEKFNMKKAEQDHGISYHVNQIIYAVS